eukprot:1436074-Prymnesium_polylepis.1
MLPGDEDRVNVLGPADAHQTLFALANQRCSSVNVARDQSCNDAWMTGFCANQSCQLRRYLDITAPANSTEHVSLHLKTGRKGGDYPDKRVEFVWQTLSTCPASFGGFCRRGGGMCMQDFHNGGIDELCFCDGASAQFAC